jgi:hypothetical protein
MSKSLKSFKTLMKIWNSLLFNLFRNKAPSLVNYNLLNHETLFWANNRKNVFKI